uniref:Uncharacterized protein n=1 Tax=Arundo donax TaxID=35708 RepID=A0A0A9C985_ARUDO
MRSWRCASTMRAVPCRCRRSLCISGGGHVS